MPRPLLTVGMATFDDFDGVYFTITSLMIHHQQVMDRCRILVVDNNPDSPQGKVTRNWVRGRVPNGEYHPFTEATGTAQARNEVFRLARTPAVLCIDCHVLLVPGALERLIDYYSKNPACRDLLTGPLISDSGQVVATHQRPQWGGGAWGVWSRDERGMNLDNPPFPIWQQGMGLFSCRRDAWVGFHPGFRGFGGCETYVMEKFRKRGAQVLCCPWLRWSHRFQRPGGVPYPINRSDRLRNYVIGFEELGLPIKPVHDAFQTLAKRPPKPASDDGKVNDRYAVVGSPKFGGVNMRGRILARELQCKLILPRQVRGMARRETIVAIKNGFAGDVVRSKCDRLVFDPLDSFYASNREADPALYWKQLYEQFKFDDILATSPACQEVMRKGLPAHVQVHLVPHQCDSRIQSDWRDPEGPVVYAGLSTFVASGLDRIREACRLIGKRFVMSPNCGVLRGASLVLSLRLPPWNTELNRWCKPQIKLENAAAAGLPAVSTDCPASVSRFLDVTVVRPDFTAKELAAAMRKALEGPALSKPFRDADYVTSMERILTSRPVVASPPLAKPRKLDGKRLVIYTAIFGDRDRLHEPAEVEPGIEYVCFTDNPNLKSRTWQIRYCGPTDDPLMESKRFKILSHEVLNCDCSIWIDARIFLKATGEALRALTADIGLIQHPHRNCIYEEANHCLTIQRGDPRRIRQAVAGYRKEGHPEGYGLWMGGVVIRRHTPDVARFNSEWWREVNRRTPRDQIVLPVVLRRLGVSYQTLRRGSLHLRIRRHGE